MKNGKSEWDDPKITSLSVARKAADNKKRAAYWGQFNIKQRLVGYLLIAMALGMLVYWGRKLLGSFSFAP